MTSRNNPLSPVSAIPEKKPKQSKGEKRKGDGSNLTPREKENRSQGMWGEKKKDNYPAEEGLRRKERKGLEICDKGITKGRRLRESAQPLFTDTIKRERPNMITADK